MVGIKIIGHPEHRRIITAFASIRRIRQSIAMQNIEQQSSRSYRIYDNIRNTLQYVPRLRKARNVANDVARAYITTVSIRRRPVF